ncbi:hypothetical protein BDQ17DRAFT_1334250 [Cyathus striatus]|nr:hypothetical protein BDQ17DRAFT_1338467 [Cyathus striatus]KAF8989128.1 hypothetical protein BDQ17DRAFT_1334250 [Cyathus striatus]
MPARIHNEYIVWPGTSNISVDDLPLLFQYASEIPLVDLHVIIDSSTMEIRDMFVSQSLPAYRSLHLWDMITPDVFGPRIALTMYTSTETRNIRRYDVHSVVRNWLLKGMSRCVGVLRCWLELG